MSTSWPQRKAQLRTLLDCNGDDEEEGLALDRALHGQVVLGKIRMRAAHTFRRHEVDDFSQKIEALWQTFVSLTRT